MDYAPGSDFALPISVVEGGGIQGGRRSPEGSAADAFYASSRPESFSEYLMEQVNCMQQVDETTRTVCCFLIECLLLTEADIDRAVGNSLSGRFRLGEFDGDSCPYNTEPAETDTLLHRAVNRCAAMEQMCLLHNRGILPLQLQPDARVAVIGPLGNENYRDWYTGVSSYAVPILEGLRQQLGAENVLFDDGY